MYASMQENPSLDAARVLARRATAQGGECLSIALLEEQVCAEAGLWETAVARRALSQSRGDTAHAVSMLRVWAATQPHVPALPVDPRDIAVLRRLSSAYPQIPRGQWLGMAPDLVPRQLNWEDGPPVEDGPSCTAETPVNAPTGAETPRVRDLIDATRMEAEPAEGDGDDPARSVLTPPFSRVDRMAMLARGETGALVALAALILGRRQEAVMVELRVAVAGVRTPHPRTGLSCVIAEVPITEVEVVVDADVDGRPGLATGWGASLGTVERRAISLALLDAAMRASGESDEVLTLDEQTVVAAADGPATAGFVEHVRLPHYATFAAYVAGVTGTAT
ncbi:MAG: carbon-phosphorus lyase complex subunit PhnI [Mycobacterium sp.]|nr:carbon-phosphorus lyase complex subunit PhnI [Mycobacterium sp.]